MTFDLCSEWKCLLCNERVREFELNEHKQLHGAYARYGIMWPTEMSRPAELICPVPIYQSRFLAKQIGVANVYICDEGVNISGSMKDYGVSVAIRHGVAIGCDHFFVASSGNHAVSLAMLAHRAGQQSVVFAPASSSKLSGLSSMPSVSVFGIMDSIFEDVYNMVAQADFSDMYNVNVSNELILPGFSAVVHHVRRVEIPPTHILSAVGNGTYLAGIVLGFQLLGHSLPKIIPIGMRGAFPTQDAFQEGELIHEYTNFGYPEQEIDAAEGSIAIESYSMPQLMHAVRVSGGFPLGDLVNHDVSEAYRVLAMDVDLLSNGVIPEPTAIIPLAAALKWHSRFSKDDILMIVFTGHGAKDIHGIKKFAGDKAEILVQSAERSRPDLADLFNMPVNCGNGVIILKKNISSEDFSQVVKDKLFAISQRR